MKGVICIFIAALIETLGSSPITQIAERLGGWPLIKGEEWNKDNTWSWPETVKKFRRLGFSMDYIIDFSVGVDYKNTTNRIIDVSRERERERGQGCQQ